MSMARVSAAIGFAALVVCAALGVGAQMPGPPPPPPPPPPPVLTAAGARDQAPSRPGGPVPLGTGEIRGTVVDAGQGRPIAGAVVTLTKADTTNAQGTQDAGVIRTVMGPNGPDMRLEQPGPPGAFARPAVADGQGRFAFGALPAGSYRLSVTRSPFLTSNYGQTRPGGAGRPIQLASGQQIALTVPMPRPGSIEGTVVDELGAPLVSAQVQAVRYGTVQGARRVTASTTAGTDDRGRYRLFGLAPGDYYVNAAPQGFQMQTLQRAAIGQASYERAIQAALVGRAPAQAEQLSIFVPSIPDEAIRNFAPTYFPGTASLDTATRVTIEAGTDRTGVDITFRPVPMVRVRGIVSGSPGPHVGIQVALSSQDPNAPFTGTTVTRTQPDGSFTVGNVVPGTYLLTAATVVGTPAGGRGGPPTPLSEAERLSARLLVVVDEQDATGVVLTPQAGRSISGTVAASGRGQAGFSDVQLSLVPAPGSALVNGDLPRTTPEPDGRFELRSVPAGAFTLRANRMLKSVVIDGQDILDFPLMADGTRDFPGAVVTFADRLGQLTGSVTSADGAAVDLTAVLVAADRRYWTPNSRRVLTSRADTGGRFTFVGLPAGDYLLAALADLDPEQMANTDFLAALTQGAVQVTIADGGTHVQHIRVAR